MITSVRVKNFRSLAAVDVELGPLTVLVGPNASGKSNFVDVLRFVKDSLRLGLDTAIMDRGGLQGIRRWSAYRPYKTIEIAIDGRQEEATWKYELVIGTTTPDTYGIVRECGSWSKPRGRVDRFETQNGKWVTPSAKKMPPPPPETLALRFMTGHLGFRGIYRSLMNSAFYTIFPNVLREPHKHSLDYPLEEHGYNIASVLRKMIKSTSGYMPDLKAALAKVVSGVSDVKVRLVGGYLVVELKHEFPGKKAHFFEATQESDGTLRVLGLLVALFQKPTLSLLAVEEPELTIHPGAMGVLCDMFLEAATRGQILLTTHSPDLVSRFRPDQLRVVDREGGDTKIGGVDETQLRAINERLFSAGELMRIEGLQRSGGGAAGA